MDIAQLVRALDCGSRGRGFESHYPPFGLLAQSVEHWTFNPGVPGSSPGWLIYFDIGKKRSSAVVAELVYALD